MNIHDREQVVGFLGKYLEPYLEGDEERFLYLIAYHSDRGATRNALFPITQRTPEEVARWVERIQMPLHVAFGIVPRVRVNDTVQYAVQPESMHRVKAYYVVVDIDGEVNEAQLQEMCESGARWVIHSGHGYHLYYEMGPLDGYQFSAACKRLITLFRQNGWNADPKVHDVSRVIRLPGTINWKHPQSPRPCRIIFEQTCKMVVETQRDVSTQVSNTPSTTHEEVVRPDREPERTTSCSSPSDRDRVYTYEVVFACQEALKQWVSLHPKLQSLPVQYGQAPPHSTGSADPRPHILVVNSRLPFRKRYAGGVRIRQLPQQQNAPHLQPQEIFRDDLFDLEVEMAISAALRAKYPRVALIYPYLQRLKRIRYPHGIIPLSAMVEYLQQHVRSSRGKPIDRSDCYKLIQQAERRGLLTRTEKGYIVHGYVTAALRLHIDSPIRVVRLRSEDWNSLQSMKRTLALLPALYRHPLQKATIAQQLHVHPQTVKRNRKGTARTWKTEALNEKPVDWQDAQQLRVEHHHQGYRPQPRRVGDGYQVWRYSAAQAMVQLAIVRRRKSRRLRMTFRLRQAITEGNLLSQRDNGSNGNAWRSPCLMTQPPVYHLGQGKSSGRCGCG